MQPETFIKHRVSKRLKKLLTSVSKLVTKTTTILSANKCEQILVFIFVH